MGGVWWFVVAVSDGLMKKYFNFFGFQYSQDIIKNYSI